MVPPYVFLASAICLSLLSLTTFISNLLLLLAICRKDSGKYFKFTAPRTVFMVVLSLADLLTALTIEPFFAAYYFIIYFQEEEEVSSLLKTLVNAGQLISTVAINFSFLVVLALSWSQYIAIKHPQGFKKIVTKRNAVILMLLNLLYLVCFISLKFITGISEIVFFKINLAKNSMFLTVNLIAILLLLNVEFRRLVKRRHSWPENIPSDITTLNSIDRCKPKTRRDNLLKQFTVVVIYLAVILLLAALPHIIIAQIYLYSSDLSPQALQNLRIAFLVSDLLLFLKMCLDSFVYAWRLSSYRRAIKMLFFCRGEK